MSDDLLPSCFRAYPGAVLRLGPDGRVLESNGRLERELDCVIVNSRFGDLLDPGSSRMAWERALADGSMGDGTVRELVFAAAETLQEPRPFALVRDDNALWLVEQKSDPRLDRLRELVTDVNSELVNAQRELVKERARLRGTLQELERSNRALDEFAHAVSHDLKAPLRAIGNHASWLQEDSGEALDVEARRTLGQLCDRVARMRAMIDGVLDYARARRVQSEPERVATHALLNDVVALLDVPAHVRVEVAEDMPELLAERAPLQQVLLNLLSNAVRWSGRRQAGCVRVDCRDRGSAWEFSVADNGPGIPTALQPRIWQLFASLDPDSTSTGIGLAVVKQLVEAQGGRVWVESEAGDGAVFRFEWPKRPRGADVNTMETRA